MPSKIWWEHRGVILWHHLSWRHQNSCQPERVRRSEDHHRRGEDVLAKFARNRSSTHFHPPGQFQMYPSTLPLFSPARDQSLSVPGYIFCGHASCFVSGTYLGFFYPGFAL